MIKRVLFVIWILAGVLYLGQNTPVYAQGSSPTLLVLTADGPLTPSMAEYLERGIRTAEQQGAEAIILELDTPGGEISLMTRMVQSIGASQVPIIVFVYPPRGMAASAGTIITLAGHASAMSPGTIIGAASPVGGQGEDLGQTMQAKEKNALRAQVRGLTTRRKPEAVALAEDMIQNAMAVSADEAYQIGLVDFIATDINDLLQKMDGFQVEIGGEMRTLHTANATTQPLPSSFIEQLLGLLTNPNVAYILLTIGIQAILIELSTPGGWVAGFIGIVCLILAIYGMGVLSVNWFGIIFLIIAFVLFIVDIKAPTHGALTVAGTGSLIVGALVLFNSPTTLPALRVSPLLITGTSIFTAITFGLFVSFAIRAQRVPIRTGQESLINRVGVVRKPLTPQGTVQLGGELWTAELDEGEDQLSTGTRVQVVRSEGIRLYVRKKE